MNIEPLPGERRFAFLMHPLDADSMVDFDPNLSGLSPQTLANLTERLSGLVEPFVLSQARIVSTTGESIRGEFVIVPRTAQQLLDLPREQASAEVQAAMELAQSRGAQMIGLGAYTSVVTRGGRALSGQGVPLTTGNSFTAVACAEGIQLALSRLGERMGSQTCVAVVGATGAIGRAMSMLLAEDVGRLALIGNPEGSPDQVRRRLLGVGATVCRHLLVRHQEGKHFATRSIGDHLLRLRGMLPAVDAPDAEFIAAAERLEAVGALVITQDSRQTVPHDDVIVTATSATGTIISVDDLAPGAIVCDVSRPANVARAMAAARPDVLVIDGGVIAVPGKPDLGHFGLDRGLSFACMAETMLLTLAGHFQDTSLGTDLSPETLRMLRSLADTHGFRVAQLRSFGNVMEEADWQELLAARAHARAAEFRFAA